MDRVQREAPPARSARDELCDLLARVWWARRHLHDPGRFRGGPRWMDAEGIAGLRARADDLADAADAKELPALEARIRDVAGRLEKERDSFVQYRLQGDLEAMRARAKRIMRLAGRGFRARVEATFAGPLPEQVEVRLAREREAREALEAPLAVARALREWLRAAGIHEKPDRVDELAADAARGRPDLAIRHVLRLLKKAGRTVAIARERTDCPLCGDAVLPGTLIERVPARAGPAWIHAACPRNLTLLAPRTAPGPIGRALGLGADPPANFPALPAGDGTGTEPHGAADAGTAGGPGHSQDGGSDRGRGGRRQG